MSTGTITEQTAIKVKKSVALSGVVAGNTAVCTVGRTGNDLHYRGYDIVELAKGATFEEVSYLLIHGDLPSQSELKGYMNKLKALRGLPANVKAAYKYLILMEVACVAVMIGAGLLAGSGGAEGPALKYDFDVISAGLPSVLASAPGSITLAFLLFLVGFGIKMGMWPFGQFWVPEAYTAAPSPISSLLSSVLSKSGVYGLMRSFLWLIPASAQEQFPMGKWGMIVAVLGTVTLFTGARAFADAPALPFLLGTLAPSVRERDTFAGMIAGLLVMIAVWWATPIAFTWYVLIGTVVTFATGWLASLTLPDSAETTQK